MVGTGGGDDRRIEMDALQRHRDFHVPAADIERRIATFQSTLREMDISLAWLDHITDRHYLSGSLQAGVLLIPAVGEPAYFVRKSRERAVAESPLDVQPFPGRKGLIAAAEKLLGADGRLGLSMDVTPAASYLWLSGKLAGHAIADVGDPLRLQRATKSPWEIAQIRTAADQITKLFPEIGELFREGVSELEVSASIEHRLRILGHPGAMRIRRGGEFSFMAIVSGDGALYPTNFNGPVGAEGPSPAAPAGPGWRRLKAGETVMADIVTSFNGYHADDARIFHIGPSVDPKLQHAHAFCLDVLNALEERLKPGAVCGEIYDEVAAWAAGRGEPEGFMGYGENRVKFFGHGVGLELDEMPILASRLDTVLRPGMVVAMEPKAFLRSLGAVGCENTYVITDTGCESLCTAPRDIRCV
jgi:Xaa-Pro aminopeptidase